MEGEPLPRVVVIKRNGQDTSSFPLISHICLIGRYSLRVSCQELAIQCLKRNSSNRCNIIIHLPEVEAEHCQLIRDRNGKVVLQNLSSKYPVTVNKNVVNTSMRIRNKDILSVASRSFRIELPNERQMSLMRENTSTTNYYVNNSSPNKGVPATEHRPYQILVPSATTYKDGHRVVDKYHNCIFCGRLQLRISRHLQTVHKYEDKVIVLSNKKGKERRKCLDKLRLDGDYKHNTDVLSKQRGFLILARRPSVSKVTKFSHRDFQPCAFCKGFFLKNELCRHKKVCPFAQDEGERYKHLHRNSVLQFATRKPATEC